MKQMATVLAVLQNGDAEVLVARESACGHDCASCAGCGMQAAPIRTVVCNPLDARPGDQVEIENESRRVLGIAGVVYLLPLALFFLGYFATFAATQAEGAALWAGFFGFALGIAAAVLLNRRVRPVRPTIVRVVR